MHAVPLAAGEDADLLLLVRAAEVEPRAVGARVDRHAAPELDLVEPARDLLPDRLLRVERVAGLVDVGDLDRLPDLERARVRLLLPGDQAEERRLPRAVRSDHADDPAAREPEAQVLEEEPIAVPLGEPGGGDDLIAEARAGRDHDLGLAELLPGILVRELLVRVEPGLAL